MKVRWSAPIALGIVAVLLAASGIWARQRAAELRDDPVVRNAALTDGAATSEVKGAVADMLGKLFSYNHNDPARTRNAANAFLTGAAVGQYEAIFGTVRKAAPESGTVLSTRVTDSAVVTLRDGRARLLVFADQQTTRTDDGRSTHAPAMLAVDAVRRGDRWRITSIDTFA